MADTFNILDQAASAGLIDDGATALDTTWSSSKISDELAINAGAISTNAVNISANAGDISTNASGISINASGISTNASNISTNASAISTNASNISTNASAISANASDISDNTDALAEKLPVFPSVKNASSRGVLNALVNSTGQGADDVAAHNRLYLMPFYLPLSITLDAIGVNVTDPRSGGNVVCGIYSVDDTTGNPDSLIAETSALEPSPSGFHAISTTTNPVLEPGAYYTAIVADQNGILGPAFTTDDDINASFFGAVSDLEVNTGLYIDIGATWPSLPATITQGSLVENDSDRFYSLSLISA